MTTKTYDKIKKEIKRELVEEFVFPILRDMKDTEGEYKKEFVKRVLRTATKKPKYSYNHKTFLRQIE